MARRAGLGRGLGALIPPAEIAAGSGSPLREVPIASIRPNRLQPRSRFDEEAMSALTASIRELGVLQPILVRTIDGEPDSYELIAGERRWRAARRAGLQMIPVLVQEGTGDAESLEQALVENLHREDLNVLEEAAAYQQLIDDFGFTHEQIANRVGRSRVTITNTLRLLQLPAGVQRALADSTISAGHARALLGTPDRALQEALVERIIAEGLPVRSVEEAIREANASSTSSMKKDASTDDRSSTNGTTTVVPQRRLPEPGLLELEEMLASFLDTKVKVELRNRRGRVVIEFATLEDLERIYRKMVSSPQRTGESHEEQIMSSRA